MKRALILGIGGQDGSYLADILLEAGWEVHGMHRRSSVDNLSRIAHIRDRVTLHQGDLLDQRSMWEAIRNSECEVIFNEADQDHVGWSKTCPLYSYQVTYGGVALLLELILNWKGGREIKLFQPLSATMFDDCPAPQDETAKLRPNSPYACAKAGAWHLCKHYRREHGIDVRCAILFNHDSPRRGPGYLLQDIAAGRPIRGDLSTVVDIGYAREYMEAAVKIVELPPPQNDLYQHDYVLGTDKPWTIERLLSDKLDVQPPRNYEWNGFKHLVADSSKARINFGWNPKHDAMSVLKMIREARNG